MFALIGLIGRFLLILFVVRWVFSLFTSSPVRTRPNAAGGPRPRGGRQAQPERVGGQLVRCAQCGTYVPAASAINLPNRVEGGDVQHLCSDKCREAFAAAHA